jgi:hypothetical protein
LRLRLRWLPQGAGTSGMSRPRLRRTGIDRAMSALAAKRPKLTPGLIGRSSGDVLIEIRAGRGPFVVWLTTPWAGEHVEVPLPIAEPDAADYDRVARFALGLSPLRADAEREGDTYKIKRISA